MKFYFGRYIGTVETWLDTACRGLCDDAREKIALEVMDHYHDAYDEALRAGLGSDDAHDKALTALGDPYEARRGFRRVHLMKYELQALYPSPKVVALVVVIAAFSWAYWLFTTEPVNSIYPPVWMTYLAGRMLVRGAKPISFIVAYHTLFAIAFVLIGVNDGRFLLAMIVLVLLFCVAPICATEVHSQQKLRRLERKA